MKKILSLFLSILVVTFCWGQNFSSNSFSFTLNGNRITPPSDFNSSLKSMKLDLDDESSNTFIIQFNSIPSIEQQQKLKEEGLVLMNYLQGNAYYASVTKDFSNIKTRNAKIIRSLIPILPEYKIAQRIASGDIPAYAKTQQGVLKVVISYFDYSDEDQMQQVLKELGSTSVRLVPRFHNIRAEISQSEIESLASYSWVKNICLVDPPQQVNNVNAARNYKTNVLSSDIRGLGYGLTGKGVKIGLWDGDVEHHRDFGDRIINREYEDHDSDHGTHTCGTLAGAGIIDPAAKGMAPEATVYAWNFNRQSNGLTVPEERLISLEEDGIEITSNSFGYNYDDCPNPFNYNNTDENEDYISNLHSSFLFVYSAGNAQYNCPDGYYTTSKNLKNSLLVASVDNNEEISSFSSFGPSYDGRLIPNISGVGDWVYSSMFDNSYGFNGGTSMAAPGVAGTMALVVERYKQTHGGEKPLSSLMRAFACNTATDKGNPGPDYKYGYGVINGRRAIEVVEENTYYTDSITHGASRTEQIEIPEGVSELRIMLSWTDPAGTPGSEKVLVNDLDLMVISQDSTIFPWILDPANPSADAVRGIDQLNNLEQVCITKPKAGTYVIRISGTTIPAGLQDFSVVYDVVMPTLKITYPLTGDVLVPNSEAIICWDSEGYSKPITIEYSVDNGFSYEKIASQLSSKARNFTWEVPPDSVVANAKLRISSGSAFDETKGSFSIIATPLNVKISQAQCGMEGSLILSWDSIENAKYEVYKLNGQVFEHFGDAAVNHFEITSLTPGETTYFCIRAIDLSNGAQSERSIAAVASKPMSLVQLPFYEDFENENTSDFLFNTTEGYGGAGISYLTDQTKFGIILDGAWWFYETPDNWVDAVGDSCFLKNPNSIVRASLCNVDASAFSKDNLYLSFDLRQKYVENQGTSYFRVVVNGEYMADLNGNTIFGDTISESYKTLYYDLSNLAGEASISIVFEAVCKYRYYVGWDLGDFVAIDNVRIDELNGDYKLETLSYGNGFSQSEPITVCVRNLSGADGFEIPVSYQINDGNVVQETITDTIPLFAEINYTFSQKADLSAEGKYVIAAGVLAENDSNPKNNQQSISFTVDTLSVRMGSGLDTVYTCDARFTDDGGLFENYKADQHTTITFIPEDEMKTTAIVFEEFNLEENFEYLYIYNGTDTSSPLLAVNTGDVLPQSHTSSALGGELTFEFVSDGGVEELGWLARVHCVNRDSVDLILSEITKPSPLEGIKTDQEEIAFVVANTGAENIEHFKAFYQIDSLSPVMQEFDTKLLTGEKEEQAFSVLADLLIPGSYQLKVWIEMLGDVKTHNDSLSTEIVSLSSLPDAGVSKIEPIVSARETYSTIAAIVMNYGEVPFNNIDVAYRINGGEEVIQTISDTINSGESKRLEFNVKANLTAQNASYQIEVYTILPDDITSENDTLQYKLTTSSDYETNVVANFTGGANVVCASKSENINLVNDYTIECWVNLSDPLSYGHIFNKTNISLWYQANIGRNYYGENSFILSVETEEGEFRWYVPDSYRSGVWQHLALTVSPDNEYVFYIDGIAQQWEVYLGTAAATKSNVKYPLCLGNRPSDLIRSAIGQIDELRIWNKCLNETAIRENSMTDYAANTTGLIAYYKFNEGSGESVYDYSINDNTALVSNADVSALGSDYFWDDVDQLISNYTIDNEKFISTYDAENKTYTLLIDDADLKALIASYDNPQHAVVSVNGSVQQSGVSINDFEDAPVSYIVDGIGFNEGVQQSFKVDIVNDLSSECELESFSFELNENPNLMAPLCLMENGDNFEQKVNRLLDISALKASFIASSGATVIINDEEQSSPQLLATDYSKSLLVKVVSENERFFKNYKVFIEAKNDEAELVSFSIAEQQVGESVFDSINNTVSLWTKNDADLSTLTAEFDVSDNATMYVKTINQRNGVTVNNFNSPVIYSVVSEDEINFVDWSVFVSIDDIKPEMTLIGDSIFTVTKGKAFIDQGATAIDNVDGDISVSIIVSGNLDTEVSDSYTLTYTANDEAGNSNTINRTVLVVDDTGTEEVFGIDVDIYASDKIVYVKVPDQIEGARLTIFNVTGSRVKEYSNLHSGLNFIPTELMSGVYLVAIEKNNQVYSGKVMIQ